MHALLIEDDDAMAATVSMMLTSENITVEVVELGEDGVQCASSGKYDIILLDLTLADMSGFDVLKSLRLKNDTTPIFILSGSNGVQDKVKGLGFGADDYLIKPFQKAELIARIKAICRRSQTETDTIVEIADLSINLTTQFASVADKRVPLTTKEYAILDHLARRQGTTLTKEMLLNSLYGGMDVPEVKIIDVFICKLRKKLADASGGKNYIETVWGRGYMLSVPPVLSLAS
jgi:two-component system cell cycle response regulator CtrA